MQLPFELPKLVGLTGNLMDGDDTTDNSEGCYDGSGCGTGSNGGTTGDPSCGKGAGCGSGTHGCGNGGC